MDNYIERTALMRPSNKAGREEKETFITQLKKERTFYQDGLKVLADAYYKHKPYVKGGRHGTLEQEYIDKELGDLSKDG